MRLLLQETTMSLSAAPRPRDLSEVSAWIQRSNDLRAGQGLDARHSGYVKVEDRHFHVAQTVEGAIVSLVQWRKSTVTAMGGSDVPLIPQHNLFAVTADQRNAALQAWRLKAQVEAQIETTPRQRAVAGRQR